MEKDQLRKINIWLQGVQTVKAQLTDLQADVLLFESLHAEFWTFHSSHRGGHLRSGHDILLYLWW